MGIPLARPTIGQEELTAIGQVFETGWLGMGSKVYDFEKAIQQYLGSGYVVAVSTGTAALHLALAGEGIGPGDEVIMPSLTFAATPQAVLACGATPVFCEVHETTLNMNVDDVEKKITPRTRCIMPVHYCGRPCDLPRLLDLCERHSLRLVEDAAHAFGSQIQGRKVGSFGHSTCFSFDPIKTITCGEGGAVVVHDKGLYEHLVRKRILGIDKDTWHRYQNRRSWFYEVITPGFRYHMSNINAAIGLVQLRRIDEFIGSRRDLVRTYNDALSDISGLRLLDHDLEQTAPFCYIVRVLNGRRDELLEFLEKRGIGAGVHYIPNHLQPLFKTHNSLPVTERLYGEILSLPLYSSLTHKEVGQVVQAIEEFFSQR
jgi:dTDP-4-amino-4,6-dideoxygalactose transaminase